MQKPVPCRMRVIFIAMGIAIVGACYNVSNKEPATDAIALGDAVTSVDSNRPPVDSPAVMPDAATAPVLLGAACTTQSGCAVGYECLILTGGSGGWCSKQCTMGAGDTCDAGYTGPGIAACVLNVTPAAGPPALPYCAIICQDEPGEPTVCNPATRCNNTCTTPLACSAAITTQDMVVVGHVCF
jgi:hypothetical protein